MKKILFVAFLFATQMVSAQDKSVKSGALNAYLQLKDQLVVSDSLAAKVSSAQLSKLLKDMPVKANHPDTLAQLNSAKAKIVKYAASLSKTGNINLQRQYFEGISAEIWPLVNKTKGSTLYLQRCPMTGVKWLSLSKEIKNPYYPKNMLGCGTVIATSN